MTEPAAGTDEKGTGLPECEHDRTDKNCAACVWTLHLKSRQRDHDNFAAVLTEALCFAEKRDGHARVVLREALATLNRSDMVLSRSLDSQRGTIVGLTLALQEACRDSFSDPAAAMEGYVKSHGIAYSLLPTQVALFARPQDGGS